MKKFKKFMALVIAMIMVLGMSMSVFADKTTSHTITINARATQNEKHTYEAYQILVGTYDGQSGQLQNFTWGSNVTSSSLLEALVADSTIGGSFNPNMTAAQAAEAISKLSADGQKKALAEVIGANLTGNAVGTSSQTASPYTVTVTGDGYYFIKDKDSTLLGPDTYSSFILQVVGDETVTSKDSTTSSKKKVKDSDDTAGTTTDWQDSADWDIGDHVPFQLTGTVADDYDKYESYIFIFHDKEGAGLSFDDNAKVYVDGTEITTGFEVKTSNLDDDDTFEVVFANLKRVESVHAGSVITVEYTSTLNTNAVIGQKGNPNTSYIEFSNNPNGDQQGTGRTPADTVIVFTYKTTETKVDETGYALTGANFTLYKEVATATAGTNQLGTKGSDIKGALDENIKADALKNDSYYVVVGTDCGEKQGDASGNTFSFIGIDDGTYVLVETTVPTGYNAWNATEFTVTATHTAESDIDPDTGKKPSSEDYILTDLTGGDLFRGNLGSVILAADRADLETTITNQSGAVLPTTGGVGTTIFYIVGAVLVIGSGIILVTRRRMNAN